MMKKQHYKIKRIAFLVSMVLSSAGSYGSVVRDDIPYQTYRDFAENKGLFRPGAVDIPVYDKSGALVGRLDKAPMPDFSSSDTSGIATLVSPQYLSGVRHNGGYTGVSFGDSSNRYQLVSRNDDPKMDIHTPRLNKLVTEVRPVTPAEIDSTFNTREKNRFTAFYRMGSGTQLIKDKAGHTTPVAGAYRYLTGGTVSGPGYYGMFGGTLMAAIAGLSTENSPLPTHTQGGDSGSPLFARDSLLDRWVLVANLSSGSGHNALWSVVSAAKIQAIIAGDLDCVFEYTPGDTPVLWSFDRDSGLGSLKQGDNTLVMHGKSGSDLNAGKGLVFSGQSGDIRLQNTVEQGAGSLTFEAGHHTVSSDNGSVWTGAGLNIAEGAEVIWKVNGVSGDNLHKIGAGTLTVNGKGINPGGLKTGDGTTILSREPDESGAVQAFSSVNIAGGRGRVVLSDEHQVPADSISWGFRGGRLDVNGNDLTFTRPEHADSGARIVNHHPEKKATVILTGTAPETVTVPEEKWNGAVLRGTPGALYEYKNHYTNTTDYFELLKAGYWYFPTDQTGNDQWRYLGHDRAAALAELKQKKWSALRIVPWQGVWGETSDEALGSDGKLDVRFRPSDKDAVLAATGGASLNGTLYVDKGTVRLSGAPVEHAGGVYAGRDEGEVYVTDWTPSVFAFRHVSVAAESVLQLGEHATLKGPVTAETGGKIAAGYRDGETDEAFRLHKCTLSGHRGPADCVPEVLTAGQRSALPHSVLNSDITLKGHAEFKAGKVIWTGSLQGAPDSRVTLGKDSRWLPDGDSTAGYLHLDGAQVSFPGIHTQSRQADSGTGRTFHTLNITDSLSGTGRFALNTDIAAGQNDRIAVSGKASGVFTLLVRNRGKVRLRTVICRY